MTVLGDLGRRINGALNEYTSRGSGFDSAALEGLLKEICNALLQSDVNVKLVSRLRDRVRTKVQQQLQLQNKDVQREGVTSREKQVLQKVC